MQSPLIGITTQSLGSYQGIPDVIPEGHLTGAAYVRAITRAGGVPCLIPLLPEEPGTLAALFGHLDGLLLPGGSDVRPSEYGSSPHPTLDRGDPGRDQVERRLVHWARERCIPLLGICRGMQLINVSLGGTLYQNIGDQVQGAGKHDYVPEQGHARDRTVHDVRLAPDSRIRSIVGTGRLDVNSIHHQALKGLGHGLVATGFAPDGVIEAIEAPEHPFLLGVQWHPEELLDADPRMELLFVGLVEAAARGSSGRTRWRARGRVAAAG